MGDGDRLYVRHHAGPAGEAVVASFDFSGRLIGDRDGQRLIGVRISTDAEQTVWFDASAKAAQQWADDALPGRGNRIQCRRCGTDDAVMLVRSYSDQDPGQLLL